MSVESCCGMFRGIFTAERCLTNQEIADGITYPKIDLGNVSGFSLSASQNELSQKSYRQKCGLDCFYSEVESVNIAITLNCFQAELLNIALGGESYDYAGGTVTDEFTYSGQTGADDLTFCPGRFPKPAPAPVVTHPTLGDISSFFDFKNGKLIFNGDINSGADPLVAGTPQDISVEYTSCAYKKVNLFTCRSIYHSIRFDGCNVLDNKRVNFAIDRVRLSPTNSFDFIGDDLISYEVNGVALAGDGNFTDPNGVEALSPFGCFLIEA